MLDMEDVVWRRAGTGFALHVPRLSLRPGITLLAGRNGAGKTSLLELLGTAAFPQEGRITYDGMTADRDLPTIRASIGFVPAGAELYEEMTPVKLLRYLAELKGGAPESELDGLLAAFRLQPFAGRKIKTLAHGVRQRIALAQALIGSPPYLFLDEPLNALDSLERLSFIRLLSAYGRKRTVLVSTHELNEWEAWAQRVLWLDDGRPLFYGSASDWTSGLPLAIWEGFATVRQYRAFDPAAVVHMRSEPAGCLLRLMAAEPPGPGFEPQAPTLEDAYFIRSRCQRRRSCPPAERSNSAG